MFSSSSETNLQHKNTPRSSGGLINYVGELFWRKEVPQEEQEDEEDNEEENQEVPNLELEEDPHDDEVEENPSSRNQEIIDLEDDDEVEEVENERPEDDHHTQHLSQLTPAENLDQADDTDHGEDMELTSNAPSDFDNQLNASNLQTLHDQQGQNIYYQGHLIRDMSYYELMKSLKTLGLRAAGKKSILISRLERAMTVGVQAADEVSESSTVQPKTPKRKRATETTPPSTQSKRASRRVQELQAGSVRVATRLASGRKTANSQKDSYLITSPRIISPNHVHTPVSQPRHRRKSTRRKSQVHTDEDEEHNDDGKAVENELQHGNQHAQTPHQDEDDDSELEGYYSPVEYHPVYDESHPPTKPESIPHTVNNKFDYEDLTDSVSIVETASVAATNGSALSPVQSFTPENGALSSMPLDHLPPPQRYPHYLMRNRIAGELPSTQHADQPLMSQQSDDDISSIVSYPEARSASSPPNPSNLQETQSVNSSSLGVGTAFDDALGAVGSRFIAMLRGDGPQLSDAEYSFFKALLESKRPPVIVPVLPSPSNVHSQTSNVVPVSTESAPATQKSIVDTCVQTEDEDYERKKRSFSETENSLPVPIIEVENNSQDSKRRRESSPTSPSAYSYPPFATSEFRFSQLDTRVDRDLVAPRRHSFVPSQTSPLPFAASTNTLKNFDSSRSNIYSPQVSAPVSLQVQNQSLSQSNQTAAISSVQRRLMRRRTTLHTQSEENSSNRASANGVVAKRILETLGEISATLDEQRKKSLVAQPSDMQVQPQQKVRFVETTPQVKLSSSGPTVKDRVATPKAFNFVSTPSPTLATPSHISGRDSLETAEPLWTRDRGRSGGPSMSPPTNSRPTLINQPPASASKDSEPEEFTFGVPTDIEGLEDDITSNLGAASHKEVRFVFSPPAKKVAKKYPPTPGGPKLKSQESLESKNLSESKTSHAKPSEPVSSGLPAALINRPNSIKCPSCMVFNDKTSERCVACETRLTSSAAGNTTQTSSSLPESLVKRPDSIKCPTCMVFNDKTAERCVACDSRLSSSDSTKPPSSAPTAKSGTGISFGSSGTASKGSGFSFSSTSNSFGTTASSTSGIKFGSSSANTLTPSLSVGGTSSSSKASETKPSTISFGSQSSVSETSTPASVSLSTTAVSFGSLQSGSKLSGDSTESVSPSSTTPVGFTLGSSTASGFSFSSSSQKPTSSITFGTKSEKQSPETEKQTPPQNPSIPTSPVNNNDKEKTDTPKPNFAFGSQSFTGFGSAALPVKENVPNLSVSAPKSFQFTATNTFSSNPSPLVPDDEDRGKKRQAREDVSSEAETQKPAFSLGKNSSDTKQTPLFPSNTSFSGVPTTSTSSLPFGQSNSAKSSSESSKGTSTSFGSTNTALSVPSGPFGKVSAPTVGSGTTLSQPFGKAPVNATPSFGSEQKSFTRSSSVATPPPPPPPIGSESPGNMDTGYSGDTTTLPSSNLPPPTNSFGSSFQFQSSQPSNPFGTTPTTSSKPPSNQPFGTFSGTSSFGSSKGGFGSTSTITPSVGGFGSTTPSTGGFGSTTTPSTSGFGSTIAPSTFGSTTPSTGGFGSTTTPSTSGFGSTIAPSTGGFGSTKPSSGFGSTIAPSTGGFGSTTTPSTSGFGSTIAPSTFGSTTTPSTSGFGSTPLPFGATGTLPSFGPGANTLQQPFGQVIPGGGSMFNLGAPDKNNQNGPKGRRKVKPTWKAP